MSLTSILTITGIIVAVVILIVLSVLTMWKKVPQDRAGVITGMKKRVISGGGGIVIPLLERMDTVSLENMQILVEVRGLTSGGVPVKVGSLTVIKIKNEKESILMAMEQFNVGGSNGGQRTVENIQEISREVLEGKLREILSGLTVEELYSDREKFANLIQENAASELAGMGLEIKSFSVKDISDEQGYIQSLGKAKTAQVKKEADIAEATAVSEREIAVAEQRRLSEIQVAERARDIAVKKADAEQVTAESRALADIAIANAQRDKDLRILENMELTEKRKATSDKAYEIQANNMQKEVVASQKDIEVTEQTKQVAVVQATAEVKKMEEKQETEIARQKSLRTAQELESTVQKQAEANAEKTKIDAEADLFKRTKDAEAKKIEEIAKSEANAVTKERQAVADATVKEKQAVADAVIVTEKAKAEATAIVAAAEAEATSIEAKGRANAEAVAAVGKAEAESIEAKGLAEAKVTKEKALAEAEGKLALAEAYKQYGEAAMTEMFISVLPAISGPIATAVSSAISQIDGITILDSGSGTDGGAGKLTRMATGLLTEVPTAIKALTGIDMVSMLQKFATPVQNEVVNDEIGVGPEILKMTYEEILNMPYNELTKYEEVGVDMLPVAPDSGANDTLLEVINQNKVMLSNYMAFLKDIAEGDKVIKHIVSAIETVIK